MAWTSPRPPEVTISSFVPAVTKEWFCLLFVADCYISGWRNLIVAAEMNLGIIALIT
jgi:hypothetical protein